MEHKFWAVALMKMIWDFVHVCKNEVQIPSLQNFFKKIGFHQIITMKAKPQTEELR